MQRRHLLAVAFATAVLLAGWSYIACLSAVTWTYIYWMRPELHYAVPAPGAAAAARLAREQLPVPKLIHQVRGVDEQ